MNTIIAPATPKIIVPAVGLAKMKTFGSIRNDIRRSIAKPLIALAHKGPVPEGMREEIVRKVLDMLGLRHTAVERSFSLMRWFGLNPFVGGSIGDTFENDLMKLIFNATAIANIADNASSSPITTISVGLHTSDPGDSGNETTNETSYTSYVRLTPNRNSGGWTVTNNSVSPTAVLDFAACTGGSATITHFHVGTASSSTGKILFSGTVSPNISVSSGVTPRLTTASTITID